MDRILGYDFENYVAEVLHTYQGAGMAIAIIDAKETCYQKFWGYRNIEKELPVDLRTIFGLASITKSFTCLAIMQLQEAGKLLITDPVDKYLPEFSYPGEGILTIENLMVHNGGYEPQPALGASIHQHTTPEPMSEEEREKEENMRAEWHKLYPEKPMDSYADIIAHLSDPGQRLLGRPGEIFSYSNDTYGVLGEIIKRVSGASSYEEYMFQNILNPLDMQRSWFAAESLAGDDNVNTLYRVKDGKQMATDNWQIAPAFTPCGFLKSTLEDMIHYLRMYLNQGKHQGKQIIGNYALAEMLKPRQQNAFQRHYSYGLSLQSLGSFSIIEHGGSLNGVSTHLAWSPELARGVIVLCNTSGVPVQNLATAAFMWCAGLPVRQGRVFHKETTWSTETIAAVQGCYRSGEGSLYQIKLSETGSLVACVDKDPTEHLLYPVLPDLALVKIKLSDTEVRLYHRDDGSIWAIGFGNRCIPRQLNEE